jgi:hypothetical protein
LSRRTIFGLAIAVLLLLSQVFIFEMKLSDATTATQSPSTISDPNNFEPSLWYSPDGSLPKNYDTRIGSVDISNTVNAQSSEPLPPAESTVNAQSYEPLPPAESKNQIWLIVNQNIYPTIKTTLTQFSTDIQSSGYNVSILMLSSGTSALTVRTLLQQGYNNSSLQGAILIGNLPTAWYEMTNPTPWGYEKFPIDYYYMDLDCNWTDANRNGVFDNYSFPMQPEIWVARIDASSMTGNETQNIINYLTKDHNYRIGNLVASRQALVYIDDDWTSSAGSTNLAVQQAYKNTILVKDYATTNATDYKNRLYYNSFEWVQLMCHGSSTSHTFKINGAVQSESVSSSYYSNANPKALFYNLFVCSGTRFTETNNLAGSIIFGNNNWGLLTIGSTKTGSMLNFWDFYKPLAQGKSIGDAFKLWSIMWADSDPKWFYGMNIFGDPLLKISQYMLAQNASVPAPTLSPSGSTTTGTSLSLSVTVSGGGATPSGTAAFQANINSGGWNTIGSPISLNIGGFASTTFTPLVAGNYQFRVVYSGDINYNGATGSTTNLTVNAGKPLNEFVFSAIGSPQNTGTAFNITITAKDAIGNTVTSYNGTNILTVSLGTISPTSTTTFTAGVWTGLVALSQTGTDISISTSGGGKTGTSNMFSVNPGDLILFRDDFNNLSNWTIINGVWTVSGGVLQGVAPNQNCLIWAGNTAWTNYQLSTNASKLNSGNVIGIVVRYTNTDNFYWMGLGCWGHKYSISKMVDGVGTELASSGSISTVEVGRWYMISAVVVDNTLQFFVDGVKVLEVQDTSLSNGAVGFITYNGTMQARHLLIQSKNFNIKIQTTDGGYALAGYINSLGARGKDFWLVKVDSVGNQQWNKTYGGPGDEVAYSLIQTIDGGYILSGSGVTVNVPADGPPYTIHNYDDSWHTTDFTIMLSATDDEFTIVKDIYYIINDGPTKTVSINGQPFINTEDNNNKLEYWSVDNLGHEELPHNVLNGVKLDKTAPTGFILINDGDAFTSSISVTLSSGAYELTSGVYQVRYSYDGVWDSEVWEFPSVSKSWTLTSGDGTKTVYYQIKDNAGLVSSTYLDTIIISTVTPTGSIVVNGGDAYTTLNSVTLFLTYSDAFSGVSQVRYSNDGIWDTEEWDVPAATKLWSLTSEDGLKTVYYQIKNNVGLYSSTYSDTIMLTTTFPTGSIVINNGAASTSSLSVTLTLTYSDAISGVSQVRYSNDGVWDIENWETPAPTRAWSLTFGDGVKSVYYQIKNNAGLTSTTYSDTILLEIIPTPTPTPTVNPTPTPTASPTSQPTSNPTSNPTQTPTSNPTQTPTSPTTPAIITPTPEPNSSQLQSPSPSPLSQTAETPLYLYAVTVLTLSAISATILILIRKKR